MSTTDVIQDARALARRFIEAFNERDLDTLRELITDDAEFRTVDGSALRGHDGLKTVVLAAQDLDVKLVPIRQAQIDERDGALDLRQPVRELIGPDDIERIAEFQIRDGLVAAFWVRPFEEGSAS
jgi:hypothetical protein